MKTTIQFTAILLFGILLTATACNKDKTPDEDKDWNVLEWTVDGERYNAECEGDPLFGCDPVDCKYAAGINSLDIMGSSLKPGAIRIYVYKHLNTSGENNTILKTDVLAFSDRSLNQECKSYFVDTLKSYELIINDLDSNERIITGNFSFTAANNCQDTLRVTDGYFKLTYRPS